MQTIVETEEFEHLWPLYWTEREYDAFQAFISENPNAGDVVRGSGGVRKVRWSRQGSGKSGGVRVIYFNRTGMANATPDYKICHARFPHPNPLPEGEGANERFALFHVNGQWRNLAHFDLCKEQAGFDQRRSITKGER